MPSKTTLPRHLSPPTAMLIEAGAPLRGLLPALRAAGFHCCRPASAAGLARLPPGSPESGLRRADLAVCGFTRAPSVQRMQEYLERWAPAAVVVFAPLPLPEREAELALAGCAGLVASDRRLDWTAAAVALAGGTRWFSREAFSLALKRLQPGAAHALAPARLTPRELELTRQVLLAASNKEIASFLGLTESTVKNHLQRIFTKLGIASRLGLALLAVAHPELLALGDLAPTLSGD